MIELDAAVSQKIQWAKNNPSLCFFPYDTIDLRLPNVRSNQIRVSCCCNLELPLRLDRIDSDPFVDLKNKMNHGHLPKDCARCIHEENTGGVSERVRDILGRDMQELANFANTRKTNSFELRVLISNVCNLACRSCDPYSSSTFAKISNLDHLKHLQLDVTEIELFWKLITKSIRENIAKSDNFYVHFMGGEPLLHKGSVKILDWLITNHLHTLTKVRITTSINVAIDNNLLIKLDQFRAIEFILSIDSVHENYHYVRWPGKFSKTVNNLNELVDYKLQSPSDTKFNYILSPVFSLNNIFYINDYLDFWYSWSKSKQHMPFFLNTNLQYRSRHLDVQALPLQYRPYLKNLLEQALVHPILSDYHDNMQHLFNFLTRTLQELDQWPEDAVLWNTFLLHTAEFDTRTNTKFNLLNDRLYHILTEQDRKLFEQKLLAVNKQRKIDFYRINDYTQIQLHSAGSNLSGR